MTRARTPYRALLARWNHICYSTGKWMGRLENLENTSSIKTKGSVKKYFAKNLGIYMKLFNVLSELAL